MERSLDDPMLVERTKAPAVAKTSRGKRTMVWAQVIAFVLGASLLVYLLRAFGQPIFAALGRVGFGFFIVVAINGTRHVLRTIAMRLGVPPEWQSACLLMPATPKKPG